MVALTRSIEKINAGLDRFRGVNKSVLQAALAGAGALLGSMLGLGIVTLAFDPTQWAILRVGFWDVFTALGIGLAVAVVQNWHLQRLEVAGRDLLRAAGLSAAGGFAGGASLVAAKMVFGIVFQLIGNVTIPHILGWTAEGLVIGLFISRAIPNLSLKAGLLAGTAAGFLGGLITGYGVWVAVGDSLKGVFLGLTIAAAEQLTKKAWIVIERDAPAGAPAAAGSRSLVLMPRSPSLLLGEQPILIGSSRACQVFVRREKDAPDVLASIELREGRIVYEDRVEMSRRELGDGSRIRMGEVRIGIRAEA